MRSTSSLFVCVYKSVSRLSVVVIGVLSPRQCSCVCKAVHDFEKAYFCVHVCACLFAKEVVTVGG